MISATERLYYEVCKPTPPKPAPRVPAATPPIHLEWADVDAILKHKRNASPEELEYIVEHAKQFCLTNWQRNQIGVQLSFALVNRARPAFYDRDQFLYQTLDLALTPAGLLHDRSWVQRELKAGAQAIADCRTHKVPRCQCWRSARERLWYIQDKFGSKSPEAWATERLWTIFEEMENASRPERTAGLGTASQRIQ